MIRKRRQKSYKSQRRWMIPRKWCLSDSAGWVHTWLHRACDRQHARGLHRFKECWAPVLRWEVGMRAPSTNQEAISNKQQLAKEKLIFLREFHWVKGQVPCPAADSQLFTFIGCVCVCAHPCAHMYITHVLFSYFCLLTCSFVFTPVCFFFSLVSFKRKRKKTWRWKRGEGEGNLGGDEGKPWSEYILSK